MLTKDPNKRISINDILKSPIVAKYIETHMQGDLIGEQYDVEAS